MTLNLKRSHIILSFFVLALLYFGLYKYRKINNTEYTIGIVIERFAVNNYEDTEQAKTYLDNSKIYNLVTYFSTTKLELEPIFSEEEFAIGDEIPLRYKTDTPKEAFIYNFWSFWFNGIIVFAIVMIVVLAFCFGFIDDNDRIILQLGKGGLKLTKNSTKQTKKEIDKLEK